MPYFVIRYSFKDFFIVHTIMIYKLTLIEVNLLINQSSLNVNVTFCSIRNEVQEKKPANQLNGDELATFR